MKKEKVTIAVALALFMVLAVGIALASPPNCFCWEACYYCDGMTGQCKIYDGPGGCFCHENPCRLNFLCCVHGA